MGLMQYEVIMNEMQKTESKNRHMHRVPSKIDLSRGEGQRQPFYRKNFPVYLCNTCIENAISHAIAIQPPQPSPKKRKEASPPVVSSTSCTVCLNLGNKKKT